MGGERQIALAEEIRLYTTCDKLPNAWGDLLPEGHFLQKEQLAINEAAQLPDVGFLYALVFKNGIAVAAAYFQVLSLKANHLNATGIPKWQHHLWRLFAGITCPKLLVAGHLFRHDVASFYAAPSLAAYEAFLCYRAAINKAMKQVCAAAILVKDLPENQVNYFQHFEPEYLLLRNDISMELEIPAEWNELADYENALKHKYAQRLRKLRQSWQSLEIRALTTSEITANKDQLYALYRQVSDHQQVRMGFLSPDFFPLLRRFYGDDLKVWGVYADGKMIAFLSAWTKGDVFDMFYIGFDYERNAALFLYFNILFFSLEQAILLKKKKLILGRTALDAKARLGCRPRYLSTFIYIKNRRIRNYVIRAQQQMTTQEGSWESRHPFKK